MITLGLLLVIAGALIGVVVMSNRLQHEPVREVDMYIGGALLTVLLILLLLMLIL